MSAFARLSNRLLPNCGRSRRMAKLQHRAADDALSLSRRSFLIGVAGASVAFGFGPMEARADAIPASPPSTFEPGIWYSIDRDGIVTVNVVRAEMGQHIGTALARTLADELEADWDKVRITAVDTDPKWGVMMTGGSNSVFSDFPVFSRVGAAGRIALVEAGAKLLGIAAQQCVARNSFVVGGNSSDSYAEIVRHRYLSRAYSPDEFVKMPINPVTKPRLTAKKFDAIDIHSKTNGTTRYGID